MPYPKLYPKSAQPLTADLFRNPTREYRAAPFWAWNSKLDAGELVWQIEQLKKLGFGGFHMHVRTGMATEYLSDEYMGVVKACIQKARDEDMLAWLYDEDRWPSGAAGGRLTKTAKHRAKHLLLTRTPYSGAEGEGAPDVLLSVREAPARTGNGRLVACYEIALNDAGELAGYRRIKPEAAAHAGTGGRFILYAYEETALPSPWYNNQTYADTLDKGTIAAFIGVTYETYRRHISESFGSLTPAIFTDEPQFSRKQALAFAHEPKDLALPWTPSLPDTYAAAYGGEDLLGGVPELLWDLPDGKPSLIRYRYHDHIAERFASAFADQCGEWCERHGLMLTGHMMEEPTLESQTAALGEAMRSYRSFQLPGIDMLRDAREFTTAKQAQSAARQYGRPGVLSELYGVTNWDFDFRGHKLQGDWQAALGVTVRVPHLSWVSMNGEAKRDYPATFSYQSPWYEQYPYIEDHFARVNTAMTRGAPVVKVGVVHPVESYWLHWGAKESTQAARDQLDSNFSSLAKWLLGGLIDFDFICESLLPGQCAAGDVSRGRGRLPVGRMSYAVVLVPPVETLRATTCERLEALLDNGGRVIFLGGAPHMVGAVPDLRAQKLFGRAERLPFERLAILTALHGVRDIEIRNRAGGMAENLLYQLRSDGDGDENGDGSDRDCSGASDGSGEAAANGTAATTANGEAAANGTAAT
ncbi:MAG: hypothetical protein LBJ10_05075, partial [Clostridiales bacterium]|nr:hypothetical protein [Clostridiales bacterium]